MRVQRFKPRFDESENKHLDRQIDEIVDSLTSVFVASLLNFAIDHKEERETTKRNDVTRIRE